MTENYAMYLRKSRADQEAELRGEGETLARHFALLSELADKREIAVTDIYREIVSGDSIAQRPQMQRLLERVSAGEYKGVLVTEVERLARGDTVDQGVVAQAFRGSQTLIITPYRTYDPQNETDEDYFEFSLFMARREYKAITRRMQAGRAASVKEGKYAGAVDVYGYRRVKLKNQKGWTLEVVPEQAAVVRMIFDWYLNGLDGRRVGKNAIADRLNEMALPAPRGDRWRASSIGNLLRNDVLRGFVTWNKRVKSCGGGVKRPLSDKKIVVKGLHEPIVSQEVFEGVQNRLKTNPPAPATSGAKLANPFAGLLFCAECGHSMIRKEDFGPASDRRPGLVCRTKGCATSGIMLTLVEDAVLKCLGGMYETFVPEDLPTDSGEAEKEACEQSVKSLNEQLSRVYAFAERGVYDEATFLSRRSELTAKLDSATKALSHIEDALSRQPRRDLKPARVSMAELYALCENAEDKNALLKCLITSAEFKKTKRCHRGDDPAKYLTLSIGFADVCEIRASRTE